MNKRITADESTRKDATQNQKDYGKHASTHENSYEEIDSLLTQAKAGDDDSMGTLILCLDPLIKKQVRHYFGKADEDYLQMGRLRALELIHKFNPEFTNVKFLGYMARMLGCYFWDLKKKELRNIDTPCIAIDEEELGQKATYDEEGFLAVEMEDLLSRLPQTESYVLRHHVLLGKSLMAVSAEMGLSKDQVRYLKKKSKQRLEGCLR